MVKSLGIGSVLHRLRLEKNLTLQQLADMVGATCSYISQLENEKVSPSIHMLKNIADTLDTSILAFFENDLVEEETVAAPQDWTSMNVKGWDADVKQMFRLIGNKKMQVFCTTIPPGKGAYEHYSHPGEEFVYVMEGTLTIGLGDKELTVPSGSAAYFSALRPHTWKNLTKVPVKMIWVCTPPSW